MYLLDTNVIIDLLNGNQKVLVNFKRCYATNSIKVVDIAFYEILRGFKYKDTKGLLPKFEKFIDKCPIMYQTRESLEIAAQNYAALRKNGLKIDDADILIGSVAIAQNAVLVTNNESHLSRLDGIKIENWTK